MNGPCRGRVLSAVLAALLAGVAATVVASAPAGDGEIAGIEVARHRVSLDAREVPLARLLAELGEVAGFETILVGGFDAGRSVSAQFDNVPLERALRSLLKGTNHILFYESAGASGGRGDLAQIWLLGPGSENPGGAGLLRFADDGETDERVRVRRRSESVLRLANSADIVLPDAESGTTAQAVLIALLAEDPAALVRARAAIALGAIADEASIDALVAALDDADSSVRAQAIGALGRIGSNRAITALGGLLVDSARDGVVRVMAARALWRHDSERAREYLRFVADDPDPQVRQAARTPPTPAQERSRSTVPQPLETR